jgi:hypothetical protein
MTEADSIILAILKKIQAKQASDSRVLGTVQEDIRALGEAVKTKGFQRC